MQAYEVLNGVFYANIIISDPKVGKLNQIFSSAEAERKGGLNFYSTNKNLTCNITARAHSQREITAIQPFSLLFLAIYS